MNRSIRSAGPVAFALSLALAMPVAAQDVQYETMTRVDLPGAAGTMVRLATRLGGGSMEVVEKASISGSRMRVDSEQSSTITDLDAGRVIVLDHEAKTWTAYTFEEMLARAQQAADEMNEALAAERSQSGDASAQGEFEFRFSVDDARQREKVAGYDARRFFLTMEAEGQYVPEGETEKQEAGTLVLLTDMWTSSDVPVLKARAAFDQTTAKEYAAAASTMMEGIAAAFADDPNMRVAFERSAQEAQKIEGMPVRTVTTFVSVAPGSRFDRAQITEPRQGGGVAQAARRAAIGGLAGRLGARQQQEREEPQAPTQATILTVTSEVRNVRTGPLDASLFAPPAGYREVQPGA